MQFWWKYAHWALQNEDTAFEAATEACKNSRCTEIFPCPAIGGRASFLDVRQTHSPLNAYEILFLDKTEMRLCSCYVSATFSISCSKCCTQSTRILQWAELICSTQEALQRQPQYHGTNVDNHPTDYKEESPSQAVCLCCRFVHHTSSLFCEGDYTHHLMRLESTNPLMEYPSFAPSQVARDLHHTKPSIFCCQAWIGQECGLDQISNKC